MSQFLAGLAPAIRRRISKIANLRENNPDFYRRWMKGEIDLDGKIIPRNPLAVDAVKARIASTRRPAVVGMATDVKTRSRLGGLPNLPHSTAWPNFGRRPMTLLAQIDLSEIPKCDDLVWIPSSGFLFYFAGQNSDDEWVEEAGRILFAEVASPERRPPPANSVSTKETINLSFEVHDTYASLAAEDDVGQWEDNNDIEAWYSSLLSFRRPSLWQIGGWPNLLQQYDMRLGAEARYNGRDGQESNISDQAATDWELLGQFDMDRLVVDASGFSRGFFWVRMGGVRQNGFDRTVLLGQAD